MVPSVRRMDPQKSALKYTGLQGQIVRRTAEAMAPSLPIHCPHCDHKEGMLTISSLTVMTLTCAECHHMWATDVHDLSPVLRQKLADALLNP